MQSKAVIVSTLLLFAEMGSQLAMRQTGMLCMKSLPVIVTVAVFMNWVYIGAMPMP